MDKNQLIHSRDGSYTLLSEKFAVTYHSKFGAVDESITVFLSAGIQYHLLNKTNPIKIFEMGFGTGLNAFLSFLESKKHLDTSFEYTGIELYPISSETASKLNYAAYLNVPDLHQIYLDLHDYTFEDVHFLSPNFKFTKIKGSILEYYPTVQYDVIFYDAFAPTAQEDLWTDAMMKKMYSLTAKGGCLVTYCAKGSFKRALKSAGFVIQALPGPPGKREMTRAIKE